MLVVAGSGRTGEQTPCSPAMLTLIAALLLLQQSFPAIEAETLAGEEVTLPKGIEAPTVMVIGFQRDHDDDLLAWVEGMGLKKAGAAPWRQITVLGERSGFVKFFIEQWMEGKIAEEELREKVVMVYRDRAEMASSFGLSSAEEVAAMVVGQDGTILARAEGSFDEEKAAALRRALSP
jgi:hypothetical protein